MAQIAGRDIRKPFRQSHRRITTHTKCRAMGDAIELLANRSVNLWMVVPMDVAPHTARAVQVLAPINVDEPTTVRALDDERLVLGHLRERVPMMAPIPVTKQIRISFVRHI